MKKIIYQYVCLIFCLTTACSTPSLLTICAPEYAGDTCQLYCSHRSEMIILDSKGSAQIELMPFMTFGMIQMKSNGLRFNFYSGQGDLTICINKNDSISFKGEHAVASDYYRTQKYPYLTWYPLESAGKDELQTYLAAYSDTLNQILLSSGVEDPEFIRSQQEDFKYSVEIFRALFYFDKNLMTQEDIEYFDSLFMEDENLLSSKNYAYAMYRYPKELILYQQKDDHRLPFESMRDILDYYVKNYKSAAIREIAIHQLALDYISEHGNDGYLDDVYRANVSDSALLKDYVEISRIWDYFWSEKACAAIHATNLLGETFDFNRYKGKYLLIDVWATWCKPCTREQKLMFEIEPEFENKEIEFVTLSCDKYRKLWEKYCTEHEMGNKNHYNTREMNALFEQLAIRFIPRFILFDPEGKLLSANFFKPSNDKFKFILNRLLTK